MARSYTPFYEVKPLPPEPSPEERARLREPLSDSVVRLLAALAGLACFALCAWTLLFGLVWTSAWLFANGLVLWARSRGRWLLRWMRALCFGVLLGTAFAFKVVPFGEFAARQAALTSAWTQAGPEGLDLRDALGLYVLHGLMGGTAFVVGLPHAGMEVGGLLLPASKSRHSSGAFPLKAPQVRAVLVEAIQELDTQNKSEGKVDLPARPVSWGPEDAVHPSLPVLMPITSPMLLQVSGDREAARWRLTVVASARVSWERRARYVMPWRVDGVEVSLDESLFFALEQRGWLHPYECTWSFTLMSDDPRLQDTTRPLRGLVEEVVAETWKLVTAPWGAEPSPTTPSRP